MSAVTGRRTGAGRGGRGSSRRWPCPHTWPLAAHYDQAKSGTTGRAVRWLNYRFSAVYATDIALATLRILQSRHHGRGNLSQRDWNKVLDPASLELPIEVVEADELHIPVLGRRTNLGSGLGAAKQEEAGGLGAGLTGAD